MQQLSTANFGLSSVVWSSQPCFQDYIGLVYAEAVSTVAKQYAASYVVAASTSSAKDFYQQ